MSIKCHFMIKNSAELSFLHNALFCKLMLLTQRSVKQRKCIVDINFFISPPRHFIDALTTYYNTILISSAIMTQEYVSRNSKTY